MRSYNEIIFKGILGRDARVNEHNGRKVATFSVATEHNVKRQDGTFDREVTWLEAVAWDGYGICPAHLLVKGARVSGTGRLRSRRYTDGQGVEKEVYEVICATLDIVYEEPRENAVKPPQNEVQRRSDIIPGNDNDLPF